ncbi:hypothetical protein GCM10009720_06180 [Yaniella flava]|uniref:DUF2267 domain-containing protein n=1 Tax=Yaniella flava TaxID=287930 RepID=A0ABP5FPY2_9MICC
MQTTEILELVEQRAELASNQEANDTMIAVLETLAERELDGEHDNFAAQLPKEFGELLTKGDPKDKDNFDAEEFVRRVGQRLDTTSDQSEKRTQAALSALIESVSDGERVDMLNKLPKDFSPYAVWTA